MTSTIVEPTRTAGELWNPPTSGLRFVRNGNVARIDIEEDDRGEPIPAARARNWLTEGTFESLSENFLPSSGTLGVERFELTEETGLAIKLDRIVRRVRDYLEEDIDDAHTEGTAAPTHEAVDACVKLARLLAPRIAEEPALKWAPYGRDDGGVSFAIQSLATNRRIDFTLSPDGQSVSGLQIDEAMATSRFDEVSISDDRALREKAEWVMRRA
jgi:hypothetical protein